MKIGIMQPYFFPYIGYWQLMNAVDLYVVFDDVNYINRGWINRNKINNNGNELYINLPLLEKSQNKKINEIKINQDNKLKEKTLKSIELSYKKAPYFNEVFPIIEEIMNNKEENLAKYLYYQITKIASYLDMKTKFIFSSELNNDKELKAQDKILDICKLLKADKYYNAAGGVELYDKAKFSNDNIQLHFIKTKDIVYKQNNKNFIANLSIIDVLMFNSKESVKELLESYTLM